MGDRPWWMGPPDDEAPPDAMEPGYGTLVELYNPAALRASIGENWDVDFLGPPDERPPTTSMRTTEEEVRAQRINRILDDPRGARRPSLHGTPAAAARLAEATASMPHFRAVTGIVRRAVLQSHHTGRPLAMPPILMVSEPGLGKTHYCKSLAQALRTTCVPIAVNGTSDRGALGGLSAVWRGAKIGKIAEGLLVKSATAAPLYLLDEIDKPPTVLPGENTLDVLLSALEPENAVAFVDEYLDESVDLSHALWLASANDVAAMPAPLLDRLLVVDVPRPDRDGARILAEAISADVIARAGLEHVADGALAPLLQLSPRGMRRVLELACGFAAADRRFSVWREDVFGALDLVVRGHSRRVGFLSNYQGEVR